MFNRCCCSMRLGISRHRTAFLCIRRSFNTSNNDNADSQNGKNIQKSEASGKITRKVRKEFQATTNENLKPENIRKKLLELKPKNEQKKPKPNEVASEEMLTAVNSVVQNLNNDISDKQKMRNELIEKLMEYEKEKFEAATSAQYSELLSDNAFAKFLESLKDKTAKPPPRAIEKRKMDQGLFLLKREIFYQALQSGHKANDARKIAERAVKIAEERVIEKNEISRQNYAEEQKKIMLKETEENDKESTFYNVAMQLARKMLNPDDESSDEFHIFNSNVIHPDCRVDSIFKNTEEDRLNIFKVADIPKLKDHSMKQWREWDENAATIWNSSFGPTNAFEEMIELTEQGKMWPYPIDNEYQIGEEENVPFYEHIFLDKYLAQYNLPEEGPVAEFMELVCIGLSKNPYMSIKKKHAHLDWFANYFKEKAEEIKRIQKSAGVLVEGSI